MIKLSIGKTEAILYVGKIIGYKKFISNYSEFLRLERHIQYSVIAVAAWITVLIKYIITIPFVFLPPNNMPKNPVSTDNTATTRKILHH